MNRRYFKDEDSGGRSGVKNEGLSEKPINDTWN